MYYQSINLYKFRYFVVSLLAIAFIIASSAVVTALGSNTVLKSGTEVSSENTPDSMADDDPNIITNMAYNISDDVDGIMLATATGVYRASRSITMASVGAGKATMQGTALVAHATVQAIAFPFHITGSVIGSIFKAHTVSSIIQPSQDTPLPAINSVTSSDIIKRFNAQQQKQLASLEAAQLVANQDLGGSILAGDPNHGGYPAKWDNIAQDSALDSWGMYSRECVSYAAWKVYQTYGDMPYWGGVGNANEWVYDAKRAGISTGTVPQVHSVAISMAGYYGHAMWVEAVRGNMIYVSQYNYDLHGHYSEMWVNGSYFTYIYFK